MLLIGAQLMLGSLARLRASDLGFRTDGLITFEMDLRAARYAEPAAVVRFGHQLQNALGDAPGIESAVLWGPGRPGRNTWITFPGREDAPLSSERMMTWRHTISAGALTALGIPILSGREFDRHDAHDRPPVVVVSETLARTLWPGEDPIGKRLRWRTDVQDSPLLTVVGVAADVKHRGRLDNLLYPARDVYVPQTQRVDRSIVAVVRASADPTAAVAAVRATVQRLDPDLPLFNIQTMAQHLAGEEAETRFGALLMSTYAGLALLLAALGIYGVLSYHVSLRARELAVRMALGARRLDVLRMVVLDGMRPASLGIGLGLAGALVLGTFLRSLLFEVESNDPSVFVSVALILGGVALAAALLPAASATRAEPVRALRGD
jgi:predicted permease